MYVFAFEWRPTSWCTLVSCSSPRLKHKGDVFYQGTGGRTEKLMINCGVFVSNERKVTYSITIARKKTCCSYDQTQIHGTYLSELGQ